VADPAAAGDAGSIALNATVAAAAGGSRHSRKPAFWALAPPLGLCQAMATEPSTGSPSGPAEPWPNCRTATVGVVQPVPSVCVSLAWVLAPQVSWPRPFLEDAPALTLGAASHVCSPLTESLQSAPQHQWQGPLAAAAAEQSVVPAEQA